MTALITLYQELIAWLRRLEGLVPLLARFLFAAILALYFWRSGLTKLGEGFWGIFNLNWAGVYGQMFPKVFEAAGYDPSAVNNIYTVIALLGTWAEFVLPVLIIIGLFTRLAALGMVGFIAVQSLTDLYGHGGIGHQEQVGSRTLADGTREAVMANPTLGGWFDAIPDHVILDQRMLWVFLLAVLILKGPGLISVDRGLKIEDPQRID